MYDWQTLAKFFRAIRTTVSAGWKHPTRRPEEWVIDCPNNADYADFLRLVDLAGQKVRDSSAISCDPTVLAEPNHTNRWLGVVREIHDLNQHGCATEDYEHGKKRGALWAGVIPDVARRSAEVCEKLQSDDLRSKAIIVVEDYSKAPTVRVSDGIIEQAKIKDTKKKSHHQHPDNQDVRDLCYRLSKQRDQRNRGKTEIAIAREFTGERPGNDRKAQNLLRQARRFPHLWK